MARCAADAAPQTTPPARPERMCVGCRRRAPDIDLLRTVARPRVPQGHTLVPDPRRVLPGRGAWVHPTAECVEQAMRRRAFGRALRVDGQIDTEPLSALLAAL